jgi:hypothetical protein
VGDLAYLRLACSPDFITFTGFELCRKLRDQEQDETELESATAQPFGEDGPITPSEGRHPLRGGRMAWRVIQRK